MFFKGVVKFPLIIKCAYIDYIKALERRQAELDKERKIKKRSGWNFINIVDNLNNCKKRFVLVIVCN